MNNKMIITFCALTALVTISYAKQQEERTPPKEAIEICLNQAENSECKATGPRGDELTGKCMTTPDNKYFACIPERMERPQR